MINIIIQSTAIWLRMIFQIVFKSYCCFRPFNIFPTQKKRIFIENISRTIIFQRYSRSVKKSIQCPKICIYYRNCYVQACNCKRTRKEFQKTTNENVLNDQKYREILQNSKILHTQFKLQVEIFQLANFCSKRIILKSSKQR